ncbi:hypothetical protein TSACC_2585 [Terrimicrobium sacchariphilum]|uniref:Oligogalacturonide lyase n=1 Tax=Terrimicrobium sacchariphilum TaxID=690879 RepID=A0A146G5D5_TERSA|nr:hypothetical protein [Terrimicrobium sacchariphilum]GAT32187.1 hypothetical protein TSACC_2585 [Terrimicrobium sacchariphilum]
MRPTPILISEFSQNRYLTYPHANGFADQGNSLVLGELWEDTVNLWKIDIATRAETLICSFPREPEPEKLLWFDISLESNRLVTIAQNTVWLFDLSDIERGGVELFHASPNHIIHPLPSLSNDGRRIVIGHYTEGRHSALLISIDDPNVKKLFEHEWWANHFHFCPHDESWIGYSHEGDPDVIRDRIWAWHADLASSGKPLFDQTASGSAIGHERWCFHATSALGIAYGVSSTVPGGLFEFFPDGRPPRLVSAGDRDWHVGVSRDGRWAVVDTTGPYDVPGYRWTDAADISDVLLVDMQTGDRTFLARSHQYMRHPRHPHPTFNLDGSAIYYNESSPDASRNRVWMIPNPAWTESDQVRK